MSQNPPNRYPARCYREELKINALYLSIDHQTLVIFLGADVGCCSTIHERMFLWGISSILYCCSCTFTCNCTTLSYHCSCTCGLCWGMSSILHCCSCSCTCLHHPTIVHLHCLGFQSKQNQHHCHRYLGLMYKDEQDQNGNRVNCEELLL